MKTLLKVLNVFFVVLGVLFFILLLVGLYLWVADPLNIKPLLFPAQTAGTPTSASNPAPSSAANSFSLTSAQIAGLKSMGIDTSKIPTTISAALDACLTAKLGATRTNEIKQGSLITAIDLYQAQSCLK